MQWLASGGIFLLYHPDRTFSPEMQVIAHQLVAAE
jgi:hypothetical protein